MFPRPRPTVIAVLAALLLAPTLLLTSNLQGQDRPRPQGDRIQGQRQRDVGPGRGGPGRGGFRGRGGPMGFMRGFGEMLRPEFMRRDAPLISTELDLDDTQRPILDALLMDYETAFQAAAEETRESFTSLRPQSPEDEVKRDERRKIIEKFRDFRRQLRDARESEGGAPDPKVMEEVEQKLDALREKMSELRPRMPDGQELAELTDRMEELTKIRRAERKALREEFLRNLRGILGDQQFALWPVFERTLRRLKSLPRGRLSGEEVDLHLVARELDLGLVGQERLTNSLVFYAEDLDRALKARDAWLETERSKMFQSFMADDIDRAVAMMDEEARLRVAVRTANERGVVDVRARLAEEFSEEIAAQFETSYRSRAFPRIYRRTRMERAFETAREFDGLEEEVVVAIAAIEEGYLTELAALNERLRQLTRVHEPQEMQQRLRRIAEFRRNRDSGGRGEGNPWRGRPEDPVREGFNNRLELEKRYREQLEVLLTDEQVEQLPELREGGRRGNRNRDRDRTREDRPRRSTRGGA